MLTTEKSPACAIKHISLNHACLVLEGEWLIKNGLPSWDAMERELGKDEGKLQQISFDWKGAEDWDSGLLVFLRQCRNFGSKKQVRLEYSNLPEGLMKILEMAEMQSNRKAVESPVKSTFVEAAGEVYFEFLDEAKAHVTLIGEIVESFLRLIRGKAMTRLCDFFYVVQQSGADALAIVSLIAFLVGIIMAFVGVVQLRQFGADIYVANLVGIAMTREMGVVMASIILAGRTGAAFAAYIGTMKVTEEIDALKIFGVSPIDFLILPRMLALFLMVPLLTLYSDFVGMFGGYVVSMSMLDVSSTQYINQIKNAVTMTHLSVGLIKSFAFGLIVAFTGCLRGLRCGSDSSAVGVAATQAVVYGITYIVIADAIFTFIFNTLNM
jgi:phospholipid/cholesterol/gamma-HCH transport system permease protein